MKKYLLISAAALALASCSSDDFLGGVFSSQKGNGEIGFGMAAPNMTRVGELTGSAAAEKLNNKFVVYGWKSDDDAAANKQEVFTFYQVNYKAGTAGTTESNTADWEYVGKDDDPNYSSAPITGSGVLQSIKYWDYSMNQYDFLAWSIASGNAKLSELAESGTSPYKKHFLKFLVPSAADLGGIYVADQVTVNKGNATSGHSVHHGDATSNGYQQNVKFVFSALAAKVRMGIYETVPGYSVQNVHFYTANSTSEPAFNKALDHAATNLYSESQNIPTSGEMTVKFKDVTVEANENKAVATTNASESDYNVSFGALNATTGPEREETGTTFVGRASNQASMSAGDLGNDGWTFVYPNTCGALHLKVNYTLVSIDGNGETIQVTGANATIPAEYCDWKMNYAYTYIFKISDNTNGTTGSTDNTTTDPAGLYPIRFDAEVSTIVDANTQETITEIAAAPITTYQHGSQVTSHSEYEAYTSNNHIFVALDDVDLISSGVGANTKLYTAVDLGQDGEGITEKTVANYANNDIVLTDITACLTAPTTAKTIPAAETINNVDLVFANSILQFAPVAGTTYVVEYTDGSSKKHYKVIKVTGSTRTATYDVASSSTQVNEGESITITVKESFTDGDHAAADYNVLGAQNYFTAPDFVIENGATPGEYTATAKALSATDNKTIALSTGGTSKTVSVKAYEFDAAAVTMAAGATKPSATVLKLDGSASSIAYTGLAITKNGAASSDLKVTGTGTYQIVASNDAAGEYKISYTTPAGVKVAEATVTVQTYAITLPQKYLNFGGVAADKSMTVNVKLGGSNANGATMTATGGATTIPTTDASGNATLTATSAADITLTLPGTSATVVVKNFGAKFYTDATCTSEVSTDLSAATGTYYVQIQEGGSAVNVTGISATGATITKAAGTGVYKISGLASGTPVVVEYNYKGQTFTLTNKAVGA